MLRRDDVESGRIRRALLPGSLSIASRTKRWEEGQDAKETEGDKKKTKEKKDEDEVEAGVRWSSVRAWAGKLETWDLVA
jgi:hypothetical protein